MALMCRPGRGAPLPAAARAQSGAAARALPAARAPPRATSAAAAAGAAGGGGEFSAAELALQGRFVGTWERVAPAEGAGAAGLAAQVGYLEAHGHSAAAAAEAAAAPRTQAWRRAASGEEGAFDVETLYAGGRSRLTTYVLGEWEETFEGASEIFGGGGEGGEESRVFRHTAWVQRGQRYEHQTESGTPLGWESTRRAVEEGEGEALMRVTRSFRARLEDGTAGDEASCEQLFRRVG